MLRLRATVSLLADKLRGYVKVRASTTPYVTISNGWNMPDMIFENNLIALQIYISFLRRATGIPNCSRYLATVRRAMIYPFSFRMEASSSSVSGLRLSSPSICSFHDLFHLSGGNFFTAVGLHRFGEEVFERINTEICLYVLAVAHT